MCECSHIRANENHCLFSLYLTHSISYQKKISLILYRPVTPYYLGTTTLKYLRTKKKNNLRHPSLPYTTTLVFSIIINPHKKMLKPGIHQSQSSKTGLFLLHKPFINGNGTAWLPIWSKPSFRYTHTNIHTGSITSNIKAIASTATEKSISVKAVVTVKPTVRGFLSNLGIERGLDDIKDLLGKTLLLELVSTELDSSKSSFKAN